MKKFISLAILSSIAISLPVMACEMEKTSATETSHNAKFSGLKTEKIAIKGATVFAVEGMTCNKCVNKVNKAISGVKGVKSVKVDLKTSKATVVVDNKVDSKTVSAAITKAVSDSGFKALKI